MFSSNAFAAVSGSLPAGFMQWYVGLMIVAVIVGTIADMIHKGSAKYFFANAQKTRAQGKPVDVGGYYQPDAAKAAAALRPSPTLNGILAQL